MRTLVFGATLALALLGCSAPDDAGSAPQPHGSRSGTGASEPPSVADLPLGEPPDLAFVRAERKGSFGGMRIWIDRGQAIVRQVVGFTERQPLPRGCCADVRVVGVDYDMDPDVFVTRDHGAWMWDTYEGREGLENPPPDSHDYFWRVGGLGRGAIVATGISSEVLVAYPNGAWGWGYVAGRRDPSSNAPVPYLERERVTVPQLWLSSRAIIAVASDGRLVELESDVHYDHAGHGWRELTGETTAFALPDGLDVGDVVPETSLGAPRRWTVLADVTDRSGRRAWVRCSLHTYACEVAPTD